MENGLNREQLLKKRELLLKRKQLLEQKQSQTPDFTEQPRLFQEFQRQRKVSPFQRAVAFGVGGPIVAAGGAEQAEEALPIVGAGLANTIPGLNVVTGGVATGLGFGVGEAARQGIKRLKGEPTDPRKIAKDAALTSGIDIATRGTGRLFFNKQVLGKAKDQVGREVGEAIKTVQQRFPIPNISKNDIIRKIDDILERVPFERGSIRTALRDIRKRLLNRKKDLTFEESVDLERQIGREARFAEKGALPTTPKTPKLQTEIRGLRADLSNTNDAFARQAGVPEFAEKSKAFSKLASKVSSKDLAKKGTLKSAFTASVLGGLGLGGPAAFGRDPDPVLGALALLPFTPANVRTAIFKKILDKSGTRALGQAVRFGGEDISRRIET